MEKKDGWKVALHNKFYKEDKLLPIYKTYHSSYDFDWYNEETNPWTCMIHKHGVGNSNISDCDWESIAHWTVFSILRMEAEEKKAKNKIEAYFKKIIEETIHTSKETLSYLKKIEEGTLSANKMSLEKAEEEIKDLKSELYDFKKSNKYLEEDNKRLEKENMRLFKEMCGFRKELNLRKAGLK